MVMSAGKSALINKMFHCNKLWDLAGFFYESHLWLSKDWYDHFILLSLSIICNSTFSCTLSRTRTSPSSRHFLLYLMTVFSFEAWCGPINVSSMFSVGVCVRGRRTEEESESDRGRKNQKRHVAGLLLSFQPTCLTSSVVHVMGDQEFTGW